MKSTQKHLWLSHFIFQIQPSGHIETRACGCREIVVTQNYLDRWIFGLEFLDELEQTLLLSWGHCVGMIVFLVKATHIGNANRIGIVSFAWAGFGAVFGPIMLFSLFWKRTNRFGAIAGMLSGGIMVFVWKYLVRPMGGAWDLYELAPAFLVSAIFIVVFSLLTKAPEEEIQEEFEEVKAM